MKCLLEHRDCRTRSVGTVPGPPAGAASGWRSRLSEGAKLDEHDSLKLLRDLQLPANPSRVVGNELDARLAARELGYPVVLKTARASGGGPQDRAPMESGSTCATKPLLLGAYRDLAKRLGPTRLWSRR